MAASSFIFAWLCVSSAYSPGQGTPRRGPARRRVVDPSSKPLEEWGAYDVPHRLAISTVAWGDDDCGWANHLRKRERGADQFGIEDISAAYNTLQSGGLEVWDVAGGSSGSKLLGQCAAANGRALPAPRVITRCAPTFPARLLSPLSSQLRNRCGATSVGFAVEQTLEDLGDNAAYVDLLLWGPAAESRSSRVAAFGAMEARRFQERMMVGEVGIANVRGGRAIRAAHRQLSKRGLRCVACTVDFSLLCSSVLDDGTLEAAKELDITVLARSPLSQGLGSGKYTIANPTGGGGFGATPKWRPRVLFRFAPLHNALAQVAGLVSKRRTDQARAENPQSTRIDVTSTQVALHWLIAKGAVPLVACNNQAHAKELLGCRNWALTKDEVDILDEVRTKRMPRFKRLPRK